MFRGTLITTSLFVLVLAGCKESTPAKTATQVAAQAAAPAKAAATAAAASDPTIAEGKRLFMTACANCHGADGTGQMMRQMMPKIGNLTLPSTHAKYDDAAFAKLISGGRDKMPAFRTIFKPDQIVKIIAYARTLAKK